MNLKIWAYLGIIVVVLGGLKWAHSSVYQSGFDAAVVQQGQLIQDAREEATKEAAAKWQILVDEAKGQIVIEERIVEVIREIEKEIPVVVETVKLECRDLGPDVLRLLNEQINASGSGKTDSTGTAP